MHPVFQRLLYVKWNLFGKKRSMKLLFLNLFYTLIWTVLGILIPRDNEHFYIPLTDNWWRVIMEAVGVILTIYFLFSEITLLKSGEKSHNCWRHWRSQHVEKVSLRFFKTQYHTHGGRHLYWFTGSTFEQENGGIGSEFNSRVKGSFWEDVFYEFSDVSLFSISSISFVTYYVLFWEFPTLGREEGVIRGCIYARKKETLGAIQKGRHRGMEGGRKGGREGGR